MLRYFVCKRFAVQTLLWLIEFVIQTNLEHDTIAAEKIIVKNDEIAKVFSKYFSETVEKLNIFEWSSCETENTEDQLTDIINKYKSHPSIKKIKRKYKNVLLS